MAADGQLYPPERHPDYRASTTQPPVGPPPIIGSVPTLRGAPTSPPVAVLRVTKKHLLAVAAIAAAIAVIVGGYFWMSRLPSVDDDKAHLEAALPTGSDLPPGLTGADTGSGQSKSAFCEQASRIPGERASAKVSYKATSLDDPGLYVGLAAYESSDDAAKAFVTVPSLMSCGADKVELTPVTGGVKDADESQTYTAGAGYLTVARHDRYLVIGVGGTARNAIKWTEFAIARL